MLRTIKKGKHRSTCTTNLLYNLSEIETTVCFTDSCKYEGSEQLEEQINKLFGVTPLFPHRNSIRFGWNYNKIENKINIFSYTYRKGVRDTHRIDRLDLNIVHHLNIKFDNNYACLYINNDHKMSIPYKSYFNFLLNPYFGGKEKAPHDINIYLDIDYIAKS